MASTPERYKAQLDKMYQRKLEWLSNNPEKKVQVVFNFPRSTYVIATISQAVEKGLVVCNDAGLELVKALWEWGVETEPTIGMVRAVLEHEKK